MYSTYHRKRPSKIIPVIILVGLIGAAYFFYATGNADDALSTARKEIPKITAQFDNGDEIAFIKQLTPEQPIQTQIITKEQELQKLNSTNNTKNNVTMVSDTSVSITELSYSKENQAIINAERESGMPVTTIGNQVVISGYIKLYDSKKQLVEPMLYKYLIDINCDFRDFCTLSPSISNRGITNIDGSFEYKLSTSQKEFTQGSYKAVIHVTAQVKDTNDRYIERTLDYDFKLIDKPQ